MKKNAEQVSIPESQFQPYIPGTELTEAFPEDRIPILQMEHLRQRDFIINRGYSYEKTVIFFLTQLAINEKLLCLRNRQNMVVLLDTEGALIREDGQWFLLFTPDKNEGNELSPDAPLIPVYHRLLEQEKEGIVRRIALPTATVRNLHFSILDEYCKNYPGGYLAAAKKIVREGMDELLSHVPTCRYGALTAVDLEEIESYRAIKVLMDDYIVKYDANAGKALQPLSVAVFGAPGSGKSFGVKQIARSSGRFQITTLNLSQFESCNDLFRSLKEALITEDGKLPLIFFDEFDSALNGQSRGWLKYLLAPMQDGEFTLDGKTETIPCGVFVFAGGTVSAFQDFLPANGEQELAFKAIKGPDFVSRLKGTLNIKGPNPSDVTDRSYIVRRAMLLRDMILRNQRSLYDEATGKIAISDCLLSALLRVSEYRHGNRSIEFLLAMSHIAGNAKFTPSCLPLTAQLNLHLDSDDFTRKLMFEQLAGDKVDLYGRNSYEAEMRRKGIEDALPWEKLSEEQREECRSRFRSMGESMRTEDFPVTIRPVTVGGGVKRITELYGPLLEKLCEFEQNRRVRWMKQHGWTLGPDDADFLTSSALRPFSELRPDQKDEVRLAVRDYPRLLNTVGLELVRRDG